MHRSSEEGDDGAATYHAKQVDDDCEKSRWPSRLPISEDYRDRLRILDRKEADRPEKHQQNDSLNGAHFFLRYGDFSLDRVKSMTLGEKSKQLERQRRILNLRSRDSLTGHGWPVTSR